MLMRICGLRVRDMEELEEVVDDDEGLELGTIVRLGSDSFP